MPIVRIIYFFLYLSISLILSTPTLRNVKKLDHSIPVAELDRKRQELPKNWAKGVLRSVSAKVMVEGEENIPSGGVLFVSNHVGNFDIPTLMASIEKPFGFLSKVEVKKLPLIRDWMEEMNCVFIDRSDRRQSVKAIRECGALLKDGHSLLIFPEGTRSKGRDVAPFKAGSLRLAKDGQVPIVPIAITGTADLLEKNKWGIRPGTVQVRILPHIPVSEVLELESKELAELLQKRISLNIQNMTTV
ncbi:lysophospholipid acyltransferase family protein [Bacillus coahuilensis]|uniref:lysophospholipid acyltransferase family protein n=2 Tax=Bacillus coahuilensis TaxID=408580 RepID=UPI000AA200DA|nr:lysophospholipid acyltransferase family protein [Bacillus coahuilensis]